MVNKIKLKDLTTLLYHEGIFKPIIHKVSDSKLKHSIRCNKEGDMSIYIEIMNNKKCIFDFELICDSLKELYKVNRLIKNNSLINVINYRNKKYGK